MFVTPAYAQAGAAGGADMLVQFLPFILIFVVMYFLIIRPQRLKAKRHQEMIANVRRGDTIVTSGGLIGKVAKVVDEARNPARPGRERPRPSGARHDRGSPHEGRTGQGERLKGGSLSTLALRPRT